MDWQDWEHEREIAAHADLDSIYGIASHEQREEAVRATELTPWYVGYTLRRGVSQGIFLAWYVGVLAALVILGGYWYGR